MGDRLAPKAGSDRDRRCNYQETKDRQHAAPAEKVADHARKRCAQQIAGHRARQRTPDRDLTLFGSDEVAGEAERNRKHTTRTDAGQNSRREQQRERPRYGAEHVGEPKDDQTRDHQADFAEHIGGRPQHRLNHGKGECKHRGETRGGGNADAELVRHVRQNRIQRARRKARRKVCDCDDIDRGWHAIMRPRCWLRHQRVTFFP